MYGSYGSYSSLSSVTTPLEIGQGSYLSTSSYETSCAFPSWPRRSSLSESNGDYQRATSYLSDDDLCLEEPPAIFEDDARSISSAGSTSSSMGAAHISEEEALEMQRERMAMQRQAIQFLVAEKERRKQASKKQRRSSSGSSKKSPKTRLSSIVEAGE